MREEDAVFGGEVSGHGDPIDDRLAKHDWRKEKIHALIAEQPRNAYEIAQAIWGNVAVTQAFLTLSEVIGHADLLVNEGRVRRRRRRRYSLRSRCVERILRHPGQRHCLCPGCCAKLGLLAQVPS